MCVCVLVSVFWTLCKQYFTTEAKYPNLFTVRTSVPRYAYICYSKIYLWVCLLWIIFSLPLICSCFLPFWQAWGLQSSWLGVRMKRRSAIVWGFLCGPVGIWRRPSIRYRISLFVLFFLNSPWLSSPLLASARLTSPLLSSIWTLSSNFTSCS